jgi:hypothetical protein
MRDSNKGRGLQKIMKREKKILNGTGFESGAGDSKRKERPCMVLISDDFY